MTQHKMPFSSLVYQTLDATRFLLPIAVGSISGGLVLGPTGVMVGAVLGTVDVGADYFNLYNKPYVAFGTIGVGLTLPLVLRSRPKFLSLSGLNRAAIIVQHSISIGGFVSMVLITTGKLNDHLDKVVAPAFGAVCGYSYAGNIGAVAGFFGGVIDEVLLGLGVTNGYCITTAIQTAAAAHSVLPAAISKYIAASIGIGAVVAREVYLPTEHKKLAVINTAHKIYAVYANNVDKEQLDKLLTDQALCIVTASLVIQTLTSKWLGHEQALKYAFESFGTSKKSAWKDVRKHARNIALFIPLYATVNAVGDAIDSFFATYIRYVLFDKFDEDLTGKENVLRLINSKTQNNTDSNTLMHHRSNDIIALTLEGSKLLSEACRSLTAAGFGVVYLISAGAQDVIMYSVLYNKLTNFVNYYLSTQVSSYNNGLTEVINQKITFIEYMRVNADSVSQTDTYDLISFKMKEITIEHRKLLEEQAQFTFYKSIWEFAQKITDITVMYIMAGYQLAQGFIEFDARLRVVVFSQDVSKLLSFEGQKAGAMISTDQSAARLMELQYRMRNQQPKQLPTRVYQSINPEHWLCLDNFTVGVSNTTLFNTEHLCLSAKSTAIIGEPRSGKSMFLRLIIGIENSAAWGNGTITLYAHENARPKLVLSSQHSNIPPYVSLIEVVMGKPYEEASEYHDQIVALFNELDISSGQDSGVDLVASLHEVRQDWASALSSGGARKKVALTGSILAHPDILILDETLTGLNHRSIDLIMRAAHSRLPGLKLLIVDHEAAAHSMYYDAELHVVNNTLVLSSLEKPAYMNAGVVVSMDVCIGNQQPVCIGNSSVYWE